MALSPATSVPLSQSAADALYIPKSLADAKGDLIAATAADTLARLAVGADGKFLSASSGETTGLAWADGGGSFAMQSYSPTLGASVTPPTLGVGGAATGRWVDFGTVAIVMFKFSFGSSGTNAGSGTYQPSLPFTVGANQIALLGGLGLCEDSSANDDFVMTCYGIAGSAFAQAYSAQTVSAGLVTHAYPFAWAASDTFAGCLVVETA